MYHAELPVLITLHHLRNLVRYQTSMTYAPKVPPGLKDKEDHAMG